MSRSAHHNINTSTYRLSENDDMLTDYQLKTLPSMYPRESHNVLKKKQERFEEVAKKEHYNEPNYGKLFWCR